MAGDILKTIVGALGFKENEQSFRPDFSDEPVQAPAETRTLVDAEEVSGLLRAARVDSFAIDTTPVDEFDFGEPEDFYVDQPENAAMEAQAERDFQRGVSLLEEGQLTIEADPQAARTAFVEDLKRNENAQKVGFEGGKFKPYPSLQGADPKNGWSEFEVAYGIRVPEEWLGEDENKWPTVQGVKLNISEGITEDEATALLTQNLDEQEEVAQKKIKGYADMSSGEQFFWKDLMYNGGTESVFKKKSPKAFKALQEGNTVEAMIRSLDFIHVGNTPHKGLLKRRVSRYNKATASLNGLPRIEEVEYGPNIRVKFAFPHTHPKITKAYANKINKAGGWLTVGKSKNKETSRIKVTY